MILLNTIPFRPYENGLDFQALIFYGFGSVIVVFILLIYYQMIPKSDLETEIKKPLISSHFLSLFSYLLVLLPTTLLFINLINIGNTFKKLDMVILCCIISLLLYFNISSKSKKSLKRQNLNNPIYQYKDILLQPKHNKVGFLESDKTTSIWVKVFVYIIVTIVVFTPFQEFI